MQEKTNKDEFGAEIRPQMFVLLDRRDDRIIRSKNTLHSLISAFFADTNR